MQQKKVEFGAGPFEPNAVELATVRVDESKQVSETEKQEEEEEERRCAHRIPRESALDYFEVM